MIDVLFFWMKTAHTDDTDGAQCQVLLASYEDGVTDRGRNTKGAV
jgi:hypothetical protein